MSFMISLRGVTWREKLSEDIRRQLEVVNIAEKIEENVKKNGRSMKWGCHLFDILVKLYFIKMMENETLVAHE